MGRKKTTEEFVADARKVHGDRYGYGKVVYTNCMKKVTITCESHGDFQQNPNHHLSGVGCAKCHHEKIAAAYRSDTESFIKKAREVHGGRYGYENAVYTTIYKKVTITCELHGDFEQRPKDHLKSHGCAKCRNEKFADAYRSDIDTFVRRAVEIHGEKYSYDNVVYVVALKKVTITCPVHGDFEQRAISHLRGHGCPKCTDTWSGDGAVYVMSTPEGHNKVGIAKSGTEHNRLNKILRSQQQKAPTAFTDLNLVCAYSFNDGSFAEARRFEGKAHRHFKLRRKQFSDKFDGSCEFFTVPVSEICSYLEQQGGKLVTIKQ